MKKSTQPPKRYTLKELVEQCDSNAPMSEDMQDWDRSPTVGLEQEVMGDILDIEQAVVRFGRQVAKHYEVTQLILFGSRARGDYHAESDADVAVILKLTLCEGSIVDAAIISAPSSTKNSSDKDAPAMHQTRNGNEWRFGISFEAFLLQA